MLLPLSNLTKMLKEVEIIQFTRSCRSNDLNVPPQISLFFNKILSLRSALNFTKEQLCYNITPIKCRELAKSRFLVPMFSFHLKLTGNVYIPSKRYCCCSMDFFKNIFFISGLAILCTLR